MEGEDVFMKHAIVIGAGLGGLSCAIRLASAGFRVTVLEQQAAPGGKLQRIERSGYRFDRGPSTITMPEAFSMVFEACGRRMEDYVTLYPLDPSTRNRFADGSVVDLTGDSARMEEQIALYSPEDAKAHAAFLREAGELYRLAEQRFLRRLLPDWRSRLNPALAAALLRVRPFTPLMRLLRRYFRHPNTLALYGRYATYVGSSPYAAPSVFAMLAHLEGRLGVYGVAGGTASLPAAFARLARELGVEIRTSVRVRRIAMRGGRACGVETENGPLAADLVVANGDVLSVCRELIDPAERPAMPDRRIDAYEPSLSGFVMLAGVAKRYPELLHHNVFFPEHYEEEFAAIFGARQPPMRPAIYVCHPGFSEEGTAPHGASSLFVLTNAPYTSTDCGWEERKERYAASVLERLERLGLSGIARPDVLELYTPEDLERDTSAYRGAIYGISSNTARQTFLRPSNRLRGIDGLWFVGGTTHPGGGTPIVTLSGQLTAEAILQGEAGTRYKRQPGL